MPKLDKFKEVLNQFNKRWDEIENTIEYNSDWGNWTDTFIIRGEAIKHLHFNDAINHLDLIALKSGYIAKTMDDSGRKIIVIGTMLGPVIVYVYSGDDVRIKYSKDLDDTGLMPTPCITSDALELFLVIGGIFGDVRYDNIGQRIETTYRLLIKEK